MLDFVVWWIMASTNKFPRYNSEQISSGRTEKKKNVMWGSLGITLEEVVVGALQEWNFKPVPKEVCRHVSGGKESFQIQRPYLGWPWEWRKLGTLRKQPLSGLGGGSWGTLTNKLGLAMHTGLPLWVEFWLLSGRCVMWLFKHASGGYEDGTIAGHRWKQAGELW